MSYAAIRIFYSLYAGIFVLIILASLSRLVFARMPVKEFTESLLVALIWPIMLFSQAGRRRFYEAASFWR